MSETRKTYTCLTCGSEEIVRNAFVFWNSSQQAWQLESLGDELWCNECQEDNHDNIDLRVEESAEVQTS